ncbi:MAG: FAD-dependent oxidoreductase, partial [Oscillospiraceae bacterium]|nr:FAD-dependent oxidoreductase [Oscillospiraceae bacterium]
MIYDAAIIGAGVVGALVARELSKYDLKLALLEKTGDPAMGATKANSAIVHAGFDPEPGTLKAKLNVKGTEMMPGLCESLSVPYKNNGSLVVAFSDDEIKHLEKLYERGVKNGVPNMELLGREELQKLEPNISPEAVGALLAPTAGIVCPYELTIAAVENAVTNGAEFIRNCEVTSIEGGGVFNIKSTYGNIAAKFVINAAGVYSDDVAAMIGDKSFKIKVRSGDYFLLDKISGDTVSHTIFQCPTKLGKGVLVTPTVDGNLLIGPSTLDSETKNDASTRDEGLDNVKTLALKSVPSVNLRNIITSFAGLRSHPDTDDFIIGKSFANGRFINAAGIESPGLSAAPAIALYVEELLREDLLKDVKLKDAYTLEREEP